MSFINDPPWDWMDVNYIYMNRHNLQNNLKDFRKCRKTFEFFETYSVGQFIRDTWVFCYILSLNTNLFKDILPKNKKKN